MISGIFHDEGLLQALGLQVFADKSGGVRFSRCVCSVYRLLFLAVSSLQSAGALRFADDLGNGISLQVLYSASSASQVATFQVIAQWFG